MLRLWSGVEVVELRLKSRGRGVASMELRLESCGVKVVTLGSWSESSGLELWKGIVHTIKDHLLKY